MLVGPPQRDIGCQTGELLFLLLFVVAVVAVVVVAVVVIIHSIFAVAVAVGC